jgi:L-methionine (R)-S-oxide reductase
MPETLSFSENASKNTKYDELLPQIENLISSELNFYANMANISAALHQCFKFHWVGFYLVDKLNEGQLVLGPFQVLYIF